MTKITPANCNDFIERFMAGETSLAEEEALYRVFRTHRHLAPELEAYREMMGWYASLSPARSVRWPRLLHIIHWAGIAALFAIVFTAALILPANTGNASILPEDYARYEGSYIVSNGDTIRDLSIVVPEIRRAEEELDRRIEEMEKAERRMDAIMMSQEIETETLPL